MSPEGGGRGAGGRPPESAGTPAEPAASGRPAEAPPVAAPAGLPHAHVTTRSFECDGVVWEARVAGQGVWGTGNYALGLVEAIYFATAVAPDVPLREVLVPRGRFATLYDSELVELFAAATPIAKRGGAG